MKTQFKMQMSALALLAGSMLCLAQDAPQIIGTDFSGAPMPKEIILSNDWKVEDGVLRSIDRATGMQSFKVNAEDWSTFDIEFKARRLQDYNSDQHFGIIFNTETDKNQLYTRGERMILWIPPLKIHDQFGIPFVKPLQVGQDAPWTTFNISVKDNTLTVKMDGKLLGTTDKFQEGIKNIQFYAYRNRVELDDLRFVVYETKKKTDEAPSPNIALNASFEECTLDNLPDYWGVPHWGIMEPYWILNHDKWQKYFKGDDTTAWHGDRSLRIENVNDAPVDNSLVLTSCNFGTKVDATYTFSAYMKADHPGVKVRMYTDYMDKPYDRDGLEFTLTDEWKRYEYTYTRKNNATYSDMLRIALLNRGTVWIDGIQLETGEAATPFQLADADRKLTVHEGNSDKELFEVPRHNPPLLNEIPALDGQLADAVWNNVPAVQLKSVSGKDVKEGATAKIFYSGDGIYLGIDVQEADADKISCSKKERDEYVWNDPSFEIFVDSKLTRGTYHYLCFNADGVQYDANLGDSTWNGNWQVKTARKPDNSGWTAEVFLPFGDFGIDYNNGPLWGFNLCRNNPRANEISSWAPTYGRFHSPLRFGQLAISEEVQKQYLVGLRDAAIRYAGEGQSELSAQIFNNTGKTETLTAVCNVKNQQGQTLATQTRTIELPDKSSELLTVGNIASNPGDNLFLDVKILQGQRLLYASNKKISTAKVLSAQVQHDYYTTEEELVIRGKADLNQDRLRETILEITVNGKDGVVHQESIGLTEQNFETRLPVAEWANDDYRMTACLLTNGQEIAKTESKFQKLPPSATEVKLDRFRRITTVNGRPFFPLGFFWEGPLTPELVEFLAKSGVNFIHTYRYTELLENPALLETAQRHGVMFEVDVAAKKGKAAEAINQLKHHPAILAWYTYDEAFTTEWGRTHQDEINQTISEAQKLDPYRPVIMLENTYGMNYVLEKDLYFPGKIPMVDVYAYPPSANIQVINNTSQSILSLGEEESRPGWFVLFTAGYGFHASRDMTPAEHEYMAYICAINGIRGISYWASFPKSASSFKALTKLFGEFKQLKDVLISLEEVPNISCNSSDIKFTVKKHGDSIYLITVNESRNPVKARFDLSEIPESRTAEILFEDRTLPVTNSGMEDNYEGLQRHVYRIR